MIVAELVRQYLNEGKRQILDAAQLAMSEGQFLRYRKLVLDALGQKGVEGALVRALENRHGRGMDRGGNTSRKEGGVP